MYFRFVSLCLDNLIWKVNSINDEVGLSSKGNVSLNRSYKCNSSMGKRSTSVEPTLVGPGSEAILNLYPDLFNGLKGECEIKLKANSTPAIHSPRKVLLVSKSKPKSKNLMTLLGLVL